MTIIFYILLIVNGEPQPLASSQMQTLQACSTQVAAFLERVEHTKLDKDGMHLQVGCSIKLPNEPPA